MKIVIKRRPIKWFLRRDWYAIRHIDFIDEERFLVDVGALTIGVQTDIPCSGRFTTWLFSQLSKLGLRR